MQLRHGGKFLHVSILPPIRGSKRKKVSLKNLNHKLVFRQAGLQTEFLLALWFKN